MTIESATTINQLVTTNPAHSDPLAEADGHLRLLKSTLKATFPSVAGVVSASDVDLSALPALRTTVAGHTTTLATQAGTLTTQAATLASHTTSIAANGTAITALQTLTAPITLVGGVVTITDPVHITGNSTLTGGFSVSAGIGAGGNITASGTISSVGVANFGGVASAPDFYQSGHPYVPSGLVALWVIANGAVPSNWQPATGIAGAPAGCEWIVKI